MRGLLTSEDKERIMDFFLFPSSLSAYWAGFLMADAALSPSGRLSLVITDRDHLRDYCGALGLSPRLFIKKRPLPTKSTHSQQWMVRFTLPHLVPILDRWGIRPNKSNQYIEPLIPGEDLFAAYLSGVTDGDGHYRAPRTWNLVGNRLFLNWLRTRLESRGFDIRERDVHPDRPYSRLRCTDEGLIRMLAHPSQLPRKRLPCLSV